VVAIVEAWRGHGGDCRPPLSFSWFLMCFSGETSLVFISLCAFLFIQNVVAVDLSWCECAYVYKKLALSFFGRGGK